MNWWDAIPYVDLTGATVPKSVIDLVPESVARENTIFPLAHEDGMIKIVTADPTDLDTMQKLQFILKKDLRLVRSSGEQIVAAINRHYGQ
jgi:type IV pilus assembly protein PilB